jgi:hypothetical protein
MSLKMPSSDPSPFVEASLLVESSTALRRVPRARGGEKMSGKNQPMMTAATRRSANGRHEEVDKGDACPPRRLRRGLPSRWMRRLWFVYSAISILLLAWLPARAQARSSTSRGGASSSSYSSYYESRGGNDPRRRPVPPETEDQDQYYDARQVDEEPWSASPPAAAATRPPPPPPPPQPTGEASAASTSSYTPIHYSFQSKEEIRPPPRQRENFSGDDIPLTSLGRNDARRRTRRDEEEYGDEAPAYASARRDDITQYMDKSAWNRWMVRLAAGSVGAGSLTFVGTSLTTKSWWAIYAWTGFWLALVTSWFRTSYGELCRSSGYLLLATLRNSRQIRRDYPTRPHLRALLGAGPRRPYPPASNPWNYRPASPEDVNFSMLPVLFAMIMVGSFCGGNVPMVPSWMGALAGAAFLGLLTTRPTTRGDLARATGMRVVASAQTVWDLWRDLGMSLKVWRVVSLLLDKLMFLDRKHRLKDRLVAFLSILYDQVMRVVGQAQQARSSEGRGDPPPRQQRRREGPPREGPPREERSRQGRPPPVRERAFREEEDSGDERMEREPRSRRDQERMDYVDDKDLDGLDPPPDGDPEKPRRGFFGF